MRELPQVQLAAGGIVWDRKGGDRRLVLVHRPKYDDWSLPKGKPDPGEEIAETALREVQEEVGIDVDFGPFAGTTHYPLPSGRTKVVLYWHMVKRPGERKFKPNREIDAIEWLTPKDAIGKLTHDVEKEFLRKNAEWRSGILDWGLRILDWGLASLGWNNPKSKIQNRKFPMFKDYKDKKRSRH